MLIEEGNEKSYIHFAELFIFRSQDLLRKKVGLEGLPLLPLCERLEDHTFRRSLKENAPVSHNSIWMKREAILHYQHSCQKMLKSIEFGECDWKRTVEEGKSNIHAFYTTLITEHFKFPVRKQSQNVAPKPKVARPVLPKAPSKQNIKASTNKKRKLGTDGVIIPVQSAATAAVAATAASSSVIHSNNNRSDDFDMGIFSSENSMLNENSLMSGGFDDASNIDQSNMSSFNESAWTSAVTSQSIKPQAQSSSSFSSFAITSTTPWNEAREELLQKKRHDEESLRLQEAHKHNIQIQRQEQLQSLRDQQEADEKRREQEEMKKVERQRKLEEDRERARRELNEQKQTIYIDNAADKDELDEFINL